MGLPLHMAEKGIKPTGSACEFARPSSCMFSSNLNKSYNNVTFIELTKVLGRLAMFPLSSPPTLSPLIAMLSLKRFKGELLRGFCYFEVKIVLKSLLSTFIHTYCAPTN